MDNNIHKVSVGFVGDVKFLEFPLHIGAKVQDASVQFLKKYVVVSIQILIVSERILLRGFVLNAA